MVLGAENNVQLDYITTIVDDVILRPANYTSVSSGWMQNIEDEHKTERLQQLLD